jgi:hypothetical protein
MDMSLRRRVAAAAFGTCTLLAYVALPSHAAGTATGNELPVSDPVMRTTTTTWPQRNVSAVFDGGRWFAVWSEDRGGGLDVMGARMETGGDRPDGGGITISTGVDDVGSLRSAVSPAVAVDGNGQFLVAWTDGDPLGNDVYAARVSAAGRVLDPAGIPISVGADSDSQPTIAWNGTTFLIAFTRSGTPFSTRAALVSPAGAVTTLGEVDANLTAPNVAVSGTSFLVVGCRGTDNITGRRIGGDGTMLGASFPITKPEVANRQVQPVVAGGPNGWIAAWTDERNESTGVSDIYAARVASNGTVTDPDGIPISVETGAQDGPKIGMRGGNAVVAWRDSRDGEGDAFAARVSGSGVVSEPHGFAVSATAEGEAPGAVVGGPGSGFSVFYQRIATEAPYGGSNHAFVRTVSPK